MKHVITSSYSLDEDDLVFTYIRSSGPGGQNVNKVSSAAEMRFDWASAAMPETMRERFVRLAGRKANLDGTMIIKAQRFSSQERNRADAIERLLALLQEAAIVPVYRRPTRPTRGSKERRLTAKKAQKSIKSGRQRVIEDA